MWGLAWLPLPEDAIIVAAVEDTDHGCLDNRGSFADEGGGGVGSAIAGDSEQRDVTNLRSGAGDLVFRVEGFRVTHNPTFYLETLNPKTLATNCPLPPRSCNDSLSMSGAASLYQGYIFGGREKREE